MPSRSGKREWWLVVGVFFVVGMGWRYLARPDQREVPWTPVEFPRSVIDSKPSVAVDDSLPAPSLEEVFAVDPVFRPPWLVRHLERTNTAAVQAAFQKLLDLSPASSYERARNTFLDSLYDYVFLRWIECDPLDGWSHLRLLDQVDLNSRYLALWGDRDPEAAAANLTRRERLHHMEQIIEAAGRRDPPQALALFFANEDTWSGRSIPETIIEAVGRHCPERFPELADRARRLGSGSARNVARAWARSEPERALEWADGLYPLESFSRRSSLQFQASDSMNVQTPIQPRTLPLVLAPAVLPHLQGAPHRKRDTSCAHLRNGLCGVWHTAVRP